MIKSMFLVDDATDTIVNVVVIDTERPMNKQFRIPANHSLIDVVEDVSIGWRKIDGVWTEPSEG